MATQAEAICSAADAASGAGEAAGSPPVVRIESARFGAMEVPPTSIFEFDDGLIGMPELRRFLLLDHRPGSRLKFMLSVDDPEVAFVVANPCDFVPAYEPQLDRAARALGAAASEVGLFCLVTVPSNPLDMTINLMAPVAVDLSTMRARQLVYDERGLDPAHRILPAAAPGG